MTAADIDDRFARLRVESFGLSANNVTYAVVGEPAYDLASPKAGAVHVFNAATVGARLATTYAKASLFLANGRAAHEAGGSNVEELALMAASALAYAKALVRSGLTMDEAFGRIVLGVSLDGTVVLQDVWDAKEGVAMMAAEGVTFTAGVPMQLEAMQDDGELVMQVVHDFWRRHVAGMGIAVAVSAQ